MNNEFKYETTKAFGKIAALKCRERVLQGGKGSSKTTSLLMMFIFMAIGKKKNLVMSVVAMTLPNIRKGALRDFKKIITTMGYHHLFKINERDLTYTCGTNVIEFFSVDKESASMGARRTHLYVNEADFIRFDTYLALKSRTDIWVAIDYNPRRKFWAHKHLIGQPNVDFLKLTYLDNKFIPKGELLDLMDYKRRAEQGDVFYGNKWRVLGLGELGITEGIVFNNWKESNFVPKDAEYLGAAMDFGFTIKHPATCIKLYRYDYNIYCEVYMYGSGLIPSVMAEKLNKDEDIRDGIIIGDSASPAVIAEIASYGLNIIPTNKIQVNEGIKLMHEHKFVAVGKELVEEFTNYCMATNREGESTGVPVKDWDHCIDPIRYFVVDVISKSRSRSSSIRFL